MMMKLLTALLLAAICAASDEITRPFESNGLEFLLDPTDVDQEDSCQGCSSSTSTQEICTDWNEITINWDDEKTTSFWNLFGAFSNNNICKGLSTRAEERIEEELSSVCGVNRNNCDTISAGYVGNRDCDNVSCFLFFFFCNIQCTRISCIYDLNCDP